MKTYILTWNPKLWHWPEEQYGQEVTDTRKGQKFEAGWTCGITKSIVPGDRIFLLRQKSERGIIQSGHATSQVYKARVTYLGKGKKSPYVDYDSDALLPVHQRLRIEELVGNIDGVAWNNIMGSGISIPEECAFRLEDLWKKHLQEVRQAPTPIPEELKYVEGKPHLIEVDSYERDPKARQACLDYYGRTCAVCGFSFASVYGELGIDYIHVHHLRGLADIGRSHRIDPIKGLRPVCPNCHAMLHQTKPAMEIATLRRIIKKYQKGS